MARNYDSNWANAMNGHLGYDTGGTPVNTIPPVAGRGKLDELADVRDIIANFIGNQYKNLADPNAGHDFAYLSSILGSSQAKQLMNQVIIFNQRDDVKKLGTEDRMRQFYSMGSNNDQLNGLIKSIQNMGQGPISAMRESSNLGSKKLSGTDKETKGDVSEIQFNKLKAMAPK